MNAYDLNEILEDHQLWLKSGGSEGKRANFWKAMLDSATLRRADLRRANFHAACLVEADLRESNLREANLISADLTNADLRGADMRDAALNSANLTQATLADADLRGARLMHANLVNTDFRRANLSGCGVYGASVWDVKLDHRTEESNLTVTPGGVSAVTVDSLEMAQFVYLMLDNEKIAGAINTFGEKAVLILGRFTPERKAVLDAIRAALRQRGFVPMLFDFERPTQRDFTEVIKTLAGMSRFVIADITNPKSSPLELQAVMPDYMIPFVPIIHEKEQPFSMFKDLEQKYGKWVLDLLKYDSADGLIRVLDEAVIRPALEKADELMLEKAGELRERHVRDIQSS
jgi:hypothetical protein